MTPESNAYVPPLRFAVTWCINTAKGAGIPMESVATIAQVAEVRAVAFLSILIARTALVRDDNGLYQPGPAWQEWSTTPSRTRPKKGGSSAADEMDLIRRRLCDNLTRRRIAMGISPAELSHRSGVTHVYIHRYEKFNDPPPACALILLSKALETTVEQLVEHSAYLVGVR